MQNLEEKDWWYNYCGAAYSRRLQSKVGIFIRAHDEDEAKKLYYECVARHSDDIDATDGPELCVATMTGEEPFFLAKETIEELNKYESALV